MNFFFEYIYFRVAKFYFKWDGKGGATAIAAVCSIQMTMAFNVYLFMLRIINDTHLRKIHALEKCAVLLFFSLIFYYNYRKHQNNYNKYRNYWKDEILIKKRIKGLLVILSLLFPWTLLFLIAKI